MNILAYIQSTAAFYLITHTLYIQILIKHFVWDENTVTFCHLFIFYNVNNHLHGSLAADVVSARSNSLGLSTDSCVQLSMGGTRGDLYLRQRCKSELHPESAGAASRKKNANCCVIGL